MRINQRKHSLDKIPIGENVTGHWRDAGRPYEIELQLLINKNNKRKTEIKIKYKIKKLFMDILLSQIYPKKILFYINR